jgi:3-isopropylmalate/(R)-2-methylmalate dehydratase small subunit
MEKLTRITSVAASLPEANIDTDIIFPARFLLITARKGLGKFAFNEKRFDANGAEKPDFVLNREPFRHAEILVAGNNFGSGSSREQAVWTLRDFGIRVVISTEIGEIFYSNCFKSSVLPIVLDAARIAEIRAVAEAAQEITVDLTTQCIELPDGGSIAFDVDPFRREILLNGWDDIALILNNDAADIDAFEAKERKLMPWLYESA